MNLNAWTAEKKRHLFDDLFAGQPPREGSFDEAIWKDGKSKGQPQMGAAVYQPDRVTLEFIYNDPQGSAVILPVQLTPPERIVFLPVPSWVVESIWQGEISGSYHFESEANRLVEAFQAELAPEPNLAHFGPQMAKRRE